MKHREEKLGRMRTGVVLPPSINVRAAKYAGKCPVCGRRFGVGANVLWINGKPSHVFCHPYYTGGGP